MKTDNLTTTTKKPPSPKARRKAGPNDKRRQNKGRPRKAFQSDPDLIPLAFAAFLRELGTTRNGALAIAVAVRHGRLVGPKANRRHGLGIALLDMDYELIPRAESSDVDSGWGQKATA
jgi:hypothetical protein